MDPLPWIEPMLPGGLASLGAYLAAHVLLCLIPAFFIAGPCGAGAEGVDHALPGVQRTEARRLSGRGARGQHARGLLVHDRSAVCRHSSQGRGDRPAITFLFLRARRQHPGHRVHRCGHRQRFCTRSHRTLAGIRHRHRPHHGDDLHCDDLARARAPDDGFAGSARISGTTWYLLVMLLGLLVFGTLKVALLLDAWVSLSLPFTGTDRIERLLFDLAPYDPSKGEEGLTFHGAVLVALLIAIAPLAWKGFGSVDGRLNRWTWLALGLIALTLLAAAVRVTPGTDPRFDRSCRASSSAWRHAGRNSLRLRHAALGR